VVEESDEFNESDIYVTEFGDSRVQTNRNGRNVDVNKLGAELNF
jgi:hypothetical protein